jgi:hypothetical protein
MIIPSRVRNDLSLWAQIAIIASFNVSMKFISMEIRLSLLKIIRETDEESYGVTNFYRPGVIWEPDCPVIGAKKD